MSFSDRHESFCQEYVKDRNATQAAIRAGYSEKTARQQGSRLLTNAAIRARIGELQAEVAERNRITVDSLLSKFQEVYEGAAANGQYAAANRSLELQGKLVGLFTEKADIKMHSTSIPANAEDMDREIVRLAGILGWEVTPKAE